MPQPHPTRVAHRWLTSRGPRTAGHGLTDNILDQLVKIEAKQERLPTRGLKATPQVKRAALNFVQAVSKTLSTFAQKNPPSSNQSIVDVLGDSGAYTVFNTLENAGLGIQFWNHYWDPKTLQDLDRFLRRALVREHAAFKKALTDAAYGGQE